MRKGFILLGTAVLFLRALSAWSVEGGNSPQTLSGNVVLVKMVARQILVAYKKQGSVAETISTFQVDDKTELSHVADIAELRINDPITVKYVEESPGVFKALAVEKQAPAKAQERV